VVVAVVAEVVLEVAVAAEDGEVEVLEEEEVVQAQVEELLQVFLALLMSCMILFLFMMFHFFGI
jgi:hypothetical protein